MRNAAVMPTQKLNMFFIFKHLDFIFDILMYIPHSVFSDFVHG